MHVTIKSPASPLLPTAANRLWISDNWNNVLNGAPTFAYKIQNVTGPADKEVVIDLNYLNAAMTKGQWEKWPADADDEEYIIAAIAANLGLQLA